MYERRYKEIGEVLDVAKEAQSAPERNRELQQSATDTTRTWNRYKTSLDLMMAANSNAKHTCDKWNSDELGDRDAIHLLDANWARQPGQLRQDNELVKELKQTHEEANQCYRKLKYEFQII